MKKYSLKRGENFLLYLESFKLPTEDMEWKFFIEQKSRAYQVYYPFQIFPQKELEEVHFESITIFYGGNGSGKSTLLNVMAEKLKLKRGTLYNRSHFFEDFTSLCDYQPAKKLPPQARIMTSDEVFSYLLQLRELNEEIDGKREEILEDYLQTKFSDFHYRTSKDYEQLRKVLETRRKTQSRFTREHALPNLGEASNGQSALRFFEENFTDNQLYFLDEPENSLSPSNQMKLAQLIEDFTRFFGCQFVIATHSPFLLALKEAKIYDLDVVPVVEKKWTQLKEMKFYADFFVKHQEEFKK